MADSTPSNPLQRGAGNAAVATPSDPTIPASKPVDTFAGPAPTIVGTPNAQPGIGASQLNPSIEAQNLLTDGLLISVPRSALDGVERPVLGGIHLIAKLGQGGMGAVYYGINPRLETEIAVKILPLTTAQNGKDLVERFVREARMAAKVRSPHIAAVYDVNVENGVFYIQMEYVSGKSAGAHMRDLLNATGKGMNEGTALDICIATADGLSAAHAEGIIHRDIKPDNIMLPRRRSRATETGLTSAMTGADGAPVLDYGAAKLLDLGLARRLQSFHDKDLTLQDTGMGTPGYMPPEQAQDARSARETADVYSLGATLYALLAGHAPFRGTTPLNVAMATIQKPHEPIENTRKDLNARTLELLQDCLQKDPSKRPANGSELLAAMRACRRAIGEAAPVPAKPKSSANVGVAPAKPAAPRAALATPVPPLKPAAPISHKPAAKPPAPSEKPMSVAAKQLDEIIGQEHAPKVQHAKPQPEKAGSRWVIVAIAAAFFLFVVGAVSFIFILIAYNSPDSHKDDVSYPPDPNYNSSGNGNNFNDPKNASKPAAEKVVAIYPPWAGRVTDIRAYPTLVVKVGDPILSVQGPNDFGKGRDVFSPTDGEIEEVLVTKGEAVLTSTVIVKIRVKTPAYGK